MVRGGRESLTPHIAPNMKLDVFWSCEYSNRVVLVMLMNRFPFPIRIDRIKPIMSDHFSKYGSIRAIQPREMTNEAATKAVVVFWVSLLGLGDTQLTISLSNQSRTAWPIPTGSIVFLDRTQPHPGSTSTSNPSFLNPLPSISR